MVVLRQALLAAFLALGLLSRVAAADDPAISELLERAQAGDVDAMFRLGAAYDWGRGVNADGDQALEWYLRAAELGHAEAQNSVGSGLQAAGHFEEALEWYTRAAEQNHPLATNNLGYLYDLGLGTEQDRRRGHDLYLRAANMGWAESMWNLANMYGAGQLGEVDMFQACLWTMRAAIHMRPGERELERRAAGGMQAVRRALSRAELERCEADNWVPANATHN